MGFWSRLFKQKQLQDVLNETRKVKIQGIIFEIQKINLLDFMTGANPIMIRFDEYKLGNDSGGELNKKQLKEFNNHVKDVILSGTVRPKLSRKEEGDGSTPVDDLFKTPDLAYSLYDEILTLTYGKKKLKL